VDIVGTVQHRHGRVEDFDLTASLKGVSFSYDGFPFPMSQATGLLKLSPHSVKVEHVSASAGRGQVKASGEVRPGDPVGIDLRFDATDIALDEALRRALPVEAVRTWELFSPRGWADAAVELHLGPAAPNAAALQRKAYRITIDSRRADSPGIGIRYAPFPYPIENIHGLMKIEPDWAQASELTAGTPQSPIRLAGTLTVADGRVRLAGGDGPTAALLTAENLPVDDRLLAAVPAQGAGVRSLLSPGGSLDLALSKLAWDLEVAEAPVTVKLAAAPAIRPSAGQKGVVAAAAAPVRVVPAWVPATQPADPPTTAARSIAGRLTLRQVTLGGAEGIRATGQVDVAADALPGRSSLQADLDLDQMEFKGRLLQHVRARLVKPARPSSSTEEPPLELQDLLASTCGGRLWGRGELSLGNIMTYYLIINAEQIDLAQVLTSKDETGEASMPMSGRLAGRLDLCGVIDQPGQREASGQLVIGQGRLVRVPVILGLVNTIFLQLPTSDAFSEGQVEYYLRGNNLALRNIFLSGANASILGSGRVDLATEKVNLIFVSGAPKIVPSVIAELWRMTAEGLAPTVVSGTWRHPKMQTVPLSELQHLLQEMDTNK
jgi:hypothetical protein